MRNHQPARIPETGQDPIFSRRQFLRLGAAFTASLALPGTLCAALTPDDLKERRLVFFNTHTREKLDICYARGETYQPEALAAVNNILRDHRTNEVSPIDTRLLDLLCAIRGQAGPNACLHIISGYRSPQTNRMLRKAAAGWPAKACTCRAMPRISAFRAFPPHGSGGSPSTSGRAG
jgi:uncharacterized protein YcbK (DUF882 family)